MEQKAKKIPAGNRDLARYVRRKRTVRVLLCLGWVAVLAVGAIFYNQSHEVSVLPRIVGWRLAIWLLAATVSGVLLFRIPHLFLDRPFEGEIVKAGLSRSYSTSDDPKQSASYGFRLNTALRVRTPNGKIRRIRFEEKNGFYLYYHEGNYICHLSGLPYPIADPARAVPASRPARTADEDTTGNTVYDPVGAYLCAACGQFYREPTVCAQCGHSLIDPKELFGESDN